MTPKQQTVKVLNLIFEAQQSGRYSITAEHCAVNVPILNTAIHYYKSMGWDLISTNGDVAFVQKSELVTELVTGEVPSHFAYVSPEIEHIDRIESVVQRLIATGHNIAISNTGNRPNNLRFIMIRTADDEFIQYIWRAEPLIPLPQVVAE